MFYTEFRIVKQFLEDARGYIIACYLLILIIAVIDSVYRWRK